MIPPSLSPFGSRKVVSIVMVRGVWGASPSPSTQLHTLHKAKLSFETPTPHCIFIASFPLLFLLGTYFAPEMAPIRSL